MNRKQKVAVVVGMVVIVLLVLFPPWEVDTSYMRGSWLDGWSFQGGLAWVGDPPHNPWGRMLADTDETIRAQDPDLYEQWKQKQQDYLFPPVTINWLLMHLAAALALTVAAVLVLKER